MEYEYKIEYGEKQDVRTQYLFDAKKEIWFFVSFPLSVFSFDASSRLKRCLAVTQKLLASSLAKFCRYQEDYRCKTSLRTRSSSGTAQTCIAYVRRTLILIPLSPTPKYLESNTSQMHNYSSLTHHTWVPGLLGQAPKDFLRYVTQTVMTGSNPLGTVH